MELEDDAKLDPSSQIATDCRIGADPNQREDSESLFLHPTSSPLLSRHRSPSSLSITVAACSAWSKTCVYALSLGSEIDFGVRVAHDLRLERKGC